MTSRPRLLVLRALGLGDLLTGVPAMRALRRAHPRHRTVLAAPAALGPLALLAGAAEEVLHTPGLQPIRWDGRAPDVAVDLHGKGPESHELLQRLAPRRLLAFGCWEAGHDGPVWREEEHEVLRWCRLVEECLGEVSDPDDITVPVPGRPAPRPGAVVVHPGAAYPSRRWPVARYAAVAAHLAHRGAEVVVTGGVADVPLARAVQRLCGLPDEACLAGRTDVLDLAAQVAASRLVVCGDTGVAHLATAFGTPSVVLFGPTPPREWGPRQGPHVVLWRGRRDRGDPWSAVPDPGLLAIGVDEVSAAAEESLGLRRSPPGRSATPTFA